MWHIKNYKCPFCKTKIIRKKTEGTDYWYWCPNKSCNFHEWGRNLKFENDPGVTCKTLSFSSPKESNKVIKKEDDTTSNFDFDVVIRRLLQ